MNHLMQPLESRRLFSAVTPIVPILPFPSNIVDEPVHEYAAVSQSVRVGYMPKISVGHISQLHGTINWSDGISSPASFDRNKNGGIDILDTHTYVKPGTFSITSGMITETPWAAPGKPVPQYILLLGSVKTTATVDPTPAQLTETAGKTFTADLGKFEYLIGVTYSAQINWGDGYTTTATVTGGDPLSDAVITGSHNYQHAGTYVAHAYLYTQPVVVHPGKPTLFKDFMTLIHVL